MLATTGVKADPVTERIIQDALEEAVEANFTCFRQIEHAAQALREARPELTAVNALSLVHQYHHRQR